MSMTLPSIVLLYYMRPELNAVFTRHDGFCVALE